ncbi:type II toxin-antitoxin system VapC family toxin [Agilicoccus flavus]|uniref:type II toxin-antitoxin system VapC family toxin n=1 Tax=Agilicoccus flavus TaxID=2775968 RepID=UPI001CF61BDF|nr:type II toxin-antitoxin system VapC family toxin [Agilicoccus flavus]
MRYLLDTNVVSELRKVASPRADPRFARWARKQSATEAISAVTLFELEVGVQRIARKDAAQGAALRRWLDEVRTTFEDSVLPLTAAAATCAAGFHVPDPASDRDAFIAATAHVHGLTVVTRNTADFQSFGVPLLNPWED